MLIPHSITLRPFRETDTDFFASMASDEQVTRFIGYGKPWDGQTIKTCVQGALQPDPIDADGASRWFVATEATEAVGIVFSTRQESSVEVGYWVASDQWGRGVAGAMLDSALIMIPKAYNITKLTARVAPANTVSARLLTRRGFILETRDEQLAHYTLN
jgi:ribosomal-protein-alanine N-acetyltransferase